MSLHQKILFPPSRVSFSVPVFDRITNGKALCSLVHTPWLVWYCCIAGIGRTISAAVGHSVSLFPYMTSEDADAPHLDTLS